jgi:hypothetical protein
LLLGSDRKSFYLLFPNGLDSDNRIRANQRLSLPRPDWKLVRKARRAPTSCWCWSRTRRATSKS